MTKEAKPDTWMPLVIGDYLKDTSRLTTEQHGAYLLLIMSYWVEGPPPDDDQDLAAIARLDIKAWRKQRDKLARFFVITDGHWTHKRVEAELARWTEKKQKYVDRAAAGGRAKAAKSSASSTPQAPQKHCLKAAPQPASQKVDGPTDQSTLLAGADADARHEGAPSLTPGVISLREWKAGGTVTERDWEFAASVAHAELMGIPKPDPDRQSELAEFIATCQATAKALRVREATA